MSKNRENVTWQSANGTWNIGFYDWYSVGAQDGEDYDDEWDVDYGEDFCWVSAGHGSEYAAKQAWRGANPGGGPVVAYDEDSAKECAALDDMAAQCYDAANRDSAYRRGLHQHPSYEGSPKPRQLAPLLRDLYEAKLEAARWKLEGYSNMPDSRIPLWESRILPLMQNGKPGTLKTIAASQQAYADKLEERLVKLEEQTRANSRYSFSRNWEREKQQAKATEEVQAEIVNVRAFASNLQQLAEKNEAAAAAPAPAGKSESGPTSKAAGSSYHISPETGRPNKCYATKRPCPYGGPDAHYGSKPEARAAYEKAQGGSF